MLSGVVIEALDPSAQATFWAQALQWQVAGDSVLSPEGLYLRFVQAAEPKAHKSRLHLDLTPGNDQAGQVERLIALGARHADIGQGQVPWVVLADPEGNEFCVLAEASVEGNLLAICLDAADPAVQGQFWAATAGWEIVEQNEWVVRLQSPSGTGPRLVMGPPVAPKAGTNRLRLLVDLPESSQVDSAQALSDPEGNEFHLGL